MKINILPLNNRQKTHLELTFWGQNEPSNQIRDVARHETTLHRLKLFLGLEFAERLEKEIEEKFKKF